MNKSYIFKLLQFKELEIIGSAANDNIKYPSDIDIQEKVTTSKEYKDIYKFFLNIFNVAYKNKNIYITDFKLGQYKGKPMKWTYNDVKNGYVIKSNIKYPFEYALNQHSTIKIDIVFFNNNIANELSVNYYFHFVKRNHHNVPDQSDETVYKWLLYDARLLFRDGNYYKAMKRIYAYYLDKKEDKSKLKRFEDFFNSQFGKINKSKSSLETILLLLENKFRKVPKRQIIINLRRIQKNLPKQYHNQMNIIIDSTPHFMIHNINKLVDDISEHINTESKKWVKKNDDLFFI